MDDQSKREIENIHFLPVLFTFCDIHICFFIPLRKKSFSIFFSTKDLIYNSYSSHRIIDRIPQKLGLKII